MSELRPLLESNLPPDAQQRLIVENQIQYLDFEIGKQEMDFFFFESTYRGLLAERAQVKRILSPIRRVPAELLAEIFLYFAPSFPPESELYANRSHRRSDDKIRRPDIPWFLAHVCRSWRATALSLGRLWAIVHVDLPLDGLDWPEDQPIWKQKPFGSLIFAEEEMDLDVPYVIPGPEPDEHDDDGARVEAALEKAEACFRLSRSVPVGVFLNVGTAAEYPFLHLILRYSSKIGEMIIFQISTAGAHSLNTEESFPRLRRLVLTAQVNEGTGQPQFIFPWAKAPNLTDLSIANSGTVSADTLRLADIPLAHLTRFCQIDSEIDHSFYQNSTNLVELVFHTSWPITLLPSEIGAITLPRLRAAAISLDTYAPGPYTPFSHMFRMPSLEVVSLTTKFLDSIVDGVPFEATGLKVLRIAASSIQRDARVGVSWMMSKFSELQELSIVVPDAFSETALLDLTRAGGENADADVDADALPRLPKLQTLRLSSTALGQARCRWSVFINMLQTRFEPPPELRARGLMPLRVFEFPTAQDHFAKFEAPVDKHVVAALRALAERNDYKWDIRADDACRVPKWDDLEIRG
ncbi:hypothetical protein HMN09_00184900 [Mycena chlorophos]|uniref:F-box domain-containing protein n=1 Tax=Mycena chlorophos TaxID=658473 RepID=A0A8H6TQJ8_MYCCL|nr:hypothetical protein HMN09_00184900 [Mycena chlorophos]